MTAELQQGQPLLGSGKLAVNPRAAPFFQPRFAGGTPTTDSIGGLFEPPIIFLPFVVQLFDFTLGALFPIRVDTGALAGISTQSTPSRPAPSRTRTWPFSRRLRRSLYVSLELSCIHCSQRTPRSRSTLTRTAPTTGFVAQDNTGLAFCDNSVSTAWADNLREFVRRHEGVAGVSGLPTMAFTRLSSPH